MKMSVWNSRTKLKLHLTK